MRNLEIIASALKLPDFSLPSFEEIFSSDTTIQNVAMGALFFAGLTFLIYHDNLKLREKNELVLLGKAKLTVEPPQKEANQAPVHVLQKEERKFIKTKTASSSKKAPKPQVLPEIKKERILLEEPKSLVFEELSVESPPLEVSEKVAEKSEEKPRFEKILPPRNSALPILLLASLYNTWAEQADSSTVERSFKKEKRERNPIRTQLPKNIKRKQPNFRYQTGKR